MCYKINMHSVLARIQLFIFVMFSLAMQLKNVFSFFSDDKLVSALSCVIKTAFVCFVEFIIVQLILFQLGMNCWGYFYNRNYVILSRI